MCFIKTKKHDGQILIEMIRFNLVPLLNYIGTLHMYIMHHKNINTFRYKRNTMEIKNKILRNF